MKLDLLTNATVVDDAIRLFLIDPKRIRHHLLLTVYEIP
jgi:hypothetical protein